jgi:hypothetical protein
MQVNRFKKVYFREKLTTELNERGEEKKRDLKYLLPKGYTKADFDYSNESNTKYKANGHVIVTGQINNITVLDFDNMDVYLEACNIYRNLHTHYTVETRRGRHVYFLYDETIATTLKVKNVDVQTKGKLIIGEGTLLHRYNGSKVKYHYINGQIKEMPKILRDWACNVDTSTKSKQRDYETNIDYDYIVTDEECRNVLDMLAASQHCDCFSEYSKWLTFTAIMKTLGKKEMWDEYSQRYDSDNYNKRKNNVIWNDLKTKISINYFCKLLDIPAFKYHKHADEDVLYDQVEYYEDSYRLVNEQYVNVDYNDFVNSDSVVIESGTGTGKTTCVSNFIREYRRKTGDKSTILSIVNLISLANQQKLTFEKKGIDLKMYNEVKVNPSILMAFDACICINSLGQLWECDFSNKIVYIDEIYSLCLSLTHNDTLKHQRSIINTLNRIITTCKKLIISDAHIYNVVMELIDVRLRDENKPFVHYFNEYQKFDGVTALKYTDENLFYESLKEKVLLGETFCFASDSKAVIDKWYSKLYNMANVETQAKMFVYTSELETEIQQDWNDKIVFYSPKITTGVDITTSNASTQYMHITGGSVSSIALLQMSTRCRNMKQLNYYSNARSNASLYENYDDCSKKVIDDFAHNQLGYSYINIADFHINEQFTDMEDLYLHLYTYNCYALDLHGTNVLYFFERELEKCGFVLETCKGKQVKLDVALKNEFNDIATEHKDEKFELLKETMENLMEDEEFKVIGSIKPLVQRCNILGLTTSEDIEEYRDVIEDQHILTDFFHYNGMKKGIRFVEDKVYNIINNKMLAGLEKNSWLKIKYVYMLGGICGLSVDTLFELDNIVMPEMTKENVTLIDGIKKLYDKRDKLDAKDFDLNYIKKLYKSMVDNLTKKLKLYTSERSKRGSDRDKFTYTLNDENITKYNRLIALMCTVHDTQEYSNED